MQQHKGTVVSLRKDRRAVKLEPAGPQGEWFSFPQGQSAPPTVRNGAVVLIQFESNQGNDGRWWQNIRKYKVLAEAPPSSGAGGGSARGGDTRSASIEKQACVKAACELFHGSGEVDGALEAARMLYAWVSGEAALPASSAGGDGDDWPEDFDDDIPF